MRCPQCINGHHDEVTSLRESISDTFHAYPLQITLFVNGLTIIVSLGRLNRNRLVADCTLQVRWFWSEHLGDQIKQAKHDFEPHY